MQGHYIQQQPAAEIDDSTFVDDYALTADLGLVSSSGIWLVDYVASEHMCSYYSLFWSFEQLSETYVYIGNGLNVTAAGKGTIRLLVNVDQQNRVMRLDNVLHVPKLARSLFLVPFTGL